MSKRVSIAPPEIPGPDLNVGLAPVPKESCTLNELPRFGTNANWTAAVAIREACNPDRRERARPGVGGRGGTGTEGNPFGLQ